MCWHVLFMPTGEHSIVDTTPVLGSVSTAAAVSGVSTTTSTQQLFSQQGFPTRITVLTASKARGMAASSSTAAGGCDVKGFKVEHVLVSVGLRATQACLLACVRTCWTHPHTLHSSRRGEEGVQQGARHHSHSVLP